METTVMVAGAALVLLAGAAVASEWLTRRKRRQARRERERLRAAVVTRSMIRQVCACGNYAKRGTEPPLCGACARIAADRAAGRTWEHARGSLAS